MENRESSYYRKDGASRPPQREDASRRESTLFTELPLDSVRRTPSSGRPAPEYTGTANENRRAARPAADTGKAAPRAVPYTPQSRPVQSYANLRPLGGKPFADLLDTVAADENVANKRVSPCPIIDLAVFQKVCHKRLPFQNRVFLFYSPVSPCQNRHSCASPALSSMVFR